jgi:hypothetical protein
MAKCEHGRNDDTCTLCRPHVCRAPESQAEPKILTPERKEAIYKIAYDTSTGPVRMHPGGHYEWKLPALYEGQHYVVHAQFSFRNERTSFDVFPRDDTRDQLTEEEVTPGPEDLEFAQKCIDEGFLQVSSKNRRLARMPPDMDPVEAMKRYAPAEFEKLVSQATCWARRNMKDADHMRELTVKQFRAFKKLNGGLG